MGGFKNTELNNIFNYSLFDEIAEKVLLCSEMMNSDYICFDKKIENLEEKIRTHLLENYLENDEIRTKLGIDKLEIRFMAEVPENHDTNQDIYLGRVDIKVVGVNWLFSNSKDYYIIECKRIDGSSVLNEKFVKEGIARFASEPIKYSSYNNKNFMFGFVVKAIDIEENTLKIDRLQNKNNNIAIRQGLVQVESKIINSYLYISKYNVKEKVLELKHLFYDFSKIIVQASDNISNQ
jgi:hypothetical protein